MVYFTILVYSGVMSMAELVYQTETEAKNEILILDLLEIVGTPKLFGGKNILTKTMPGYQTYCRQVGNAIITKNGLFQPEPQDIFSPKGTIYGVAVSDCFSKQLRDDPEGQIRALVEAVATQSYNISVANVPWTKPKEYLVTDCLECFDQAVRQINKGFFGFIGLLAEQLEVNLV